MLKIVALVLGRTVLSHDGAPQVAVTSMDVVPECDCAAGESMRRANIAVSRTTGSMVVSEDRGMRGMGVSGEADC